MNVLARSALVIGFILLSACGTSRKLTCQNHDWYEIGRRDGAAGLMPAEMDKQRRSCGEEFNALAQDAYMNGRNAGLTEYCTPQNGYVMGRMGVSVKPICPQPLAEIFSREHGRGRAALELEQANVQIDRKISSIRQQITQTPSGSKDKNSLNTQLTELTARRARNEKELNKIEAGVN